MGRITINGTQAGFSCKKEVSLALWDVKTNRAKGKSEEARTLNQELDNIKAQITRHYQYICDHDSFVTAKKVISCSSASASSDTSPFPPLPAGLSKPEAWAVTVAT